MKKTRPVFFLPSVCLLSILYVVPLSAQSVADAARQERARQKNLKSAMVVASGGSAGVTSTAAAGTGATASSPSAAAKPIEPTDNNGRNEKYWRDRFQKARDDLARAEAKIQIADTKIKDLNTQLLRQSDVYNRENRIGADMTDAQKEQTDAQKQAEQARQRVSDLEDELHRAGGPPGWSR